MTTNTGRLKMTTKLAYGAGDLGAAIATAINGFFLLDFLINIAGRAISHDCLKSGGSGQRAAASAGAWARSSS